MSSDEAGGRAAARSGRRLAALGWGVLCAAGLAGWLLACGSGDAGAGVARAAGQLHLLHAAGRRHGGLAGGAERLPGPLGRRAGTADAGGGRLRARLAGRAAGALGRAARTGRRGRTGARGAAAPGCNRSVPLRARRGGAAGLLGRGVGLRGAPRARSGPAAGRLADLRLLPSSSRCSGSTWSWRSTRTGTAALFGGYFFISGLYIAVGGVDVLSALPSGARRRTALHDLGKLIVAFSLLTTYMMYSQLLPIWYENLPHEVRFVAAAPAASGHWRWVSVALLAVVYLGPLVLLLTRWAKRTAWSLGAVAAAGAGGTCGWSAGGW